MFRRSANPSGGFLPDWPAKLNYPSLMTGRTRTALRFYNGLIPTALASTPGSGTTGTTPYMYSLDPAGKFYIESVSTTSVVLGWRNAGTWSRQTLTIPTYSSYTYDASIAVSPDGTRIYFRTNAGLSEWSLNHTTKTATKVVDATFAAPAGAGLDTVYAIRWVSQDTILLTWMNGSSYAHGYRLVRKVAGTWTSLDTNVEIAALESAFPGFGGPGPHFVRQESGTTCSVRRIVDNLSGPVIVPTGTFISVAPNTAYMYSDADACYWWKINGANLECRRAPWGGGGWTLYTIAHGISSPNAVNVHGTDGSLCVVGSATSVRYARFNGSGITLFPVTTVAGFTQSYTCNVGDAIA